MKNIGDIISRQRKNKNLTQEELGKMFFVSKRSVSKWEAGRTLPDIVTLRKLCVILDINSDEMLGSSVKELRHCKRGIKVYIFCSCIFCVVLSLLCAVLFSLCGWEYIDHHTQSGITFLTIYVNGSLLPADRYSIQSDLNADNAKNGYSFNTGYGEVQGTVLLDDCQEIEYGFVNTNNWHNIQIRLDVERSGETLSVKQVVSYQTENRIFEVLITENTGDIGQPISVFREGI